MIRLVKAQLIVQGDHFGYAVFPDWTMCGAYPLDFQSIKLFQRGLDRSSVFAHNAGVIPGHFGLIILENT